MLNERVNQHNATETPERRFAGVARLYGEDAYRKFTQATAVVVGLGGVGSWAAEALARSAVGHLVLIDLDHIAISNINRQLHAMEGEFGKAKVDAMAERIRKINPAIHLTTHDAFLSASNLIELIPNGAYVLDACDDVPAKVALAHYCRSLQIGLVMCGGAGGKVNPSFVSAADLAKTVQDPFLAKIRADLRKNHNFSRDLKQPMSIRAVYSQEPRLGGSHGGLACSGYGSAVSVTGTFGFIAAAELLTLIANGS
jgi:tRNA A37 threonylcarbamoyladenosine dehydratase